MALDPITASALGGAAGTFLGGLVKAVFSGTRLDPRVNAAFKGFQSRLGTVATILKHLLRHTGHPQAQELAAKLDEVTDPEMKL